MSASRTVALVTGAARRIGRAIALDLANAGFAVAIHHRSAGEEAHALVAEIANGGGKATALEADFSDRNACDMLIDHAAAALGPVQLLVNSASLFEDDNPTDIDWELWDQHFDIHLKAPVALAGHMAASLPDGLEGLVVNVIDQRVLRLNPRFFSYTLSKSALWSATQTLAQSLAPRIRVNAIGPGPALRNDRQSEAEFRKQADAVILGHGPALEEFGRTVRYLWEAKSVTGQMIALDGGQHLAWQTADVAGPE